MRVPFRLTAVPLAVLGLAGLGLVACGSPDAAVQPSTALVERATISSGVSSTGSLSAASEQNLGFPSGGKLTSVSVKVGDHVKAGQELATIDTFQARQNLDAQKAQLKAQQALLDKAKDSTLVGNAKDSLDQAEDILSAVRRQVSQQDDNDALTVSTATQQVQNDQNAALTAQSAKTSACSGGPSPQCTSADQTYVAATQKLASSQAILRTAEQKHELDQASGRVSIENAQQAVVSARNLVDSSKSDRPHAVDQQQALVTAARAAVAKAQHDLTETTLRAPVAGTVTALNGAVGEYVAPSTGTSALAPGSEAAIPGASGASSGGTSTSALAAAGSNPARPGGTQFLVLSDIDQLRVVALFNESDAATLHTDQAVNVSFDAVPDLTVPGRVASVAPSGTSVSGVISYYVTVTLDDGDSRLKSGQTATVGIVTDERSSVLSVPNSAVRTVRGTSAVTVLEGNQKRTVTFERGLVGLDRTEVVSGLRPGQRVVVPTLQRGGGR